jgi:hypothetical protein
LIAESVSARRASRIDPANLSSVGISAVNALLTRNTQVNHADIAQHVTAVNRAFESPAVT